MEITGYQPGGQSNWLKLFTIAYRDKTGRDRKWEITSRKSEPKCISADYDPADAVVIVPFHTGAQRLVIIKEYRVALGDFEYGFPAGLIDRGETPEAAAKRELREETGLSLTRIKRISPPLYSSAGMTDESIAMVYAECEGVPDVAENRDSELIEVLTVDPQQAAALCENPQMKFDVKTWLVLTQFGVGL